MKKKPQRMCVVCRTRKEKTELVRVVLRPDKTTQIDQSGKMSGRGAYVCNNPMCLSKAGEAPLLDRGLKVPVNAQTKEQIRHRAQGLESGFSSSNSSDRRSQEHQEKRVTNEGIHRFIGIAEKAGKVVSGFDAVEHAISNNLIKLVIIATDASEGTINKIIKETDKKNIKHVIYSDKTHLGDCIGKRPKALVAITDEHFSSQLLLMMHRLEQSNHHDI